LAIFARAIQAVTGFMKIALMTEGTYPFAFGGVSVWCDQLIRGMPGYDFDVVALVGTAAQPPVWALPANVASLVTLPLWGPLPAPEGGRRAGSRRAGLPLRLLRQLIEVLLDSPAGAPDGFAVVLRELHEYSSRHGPLSASLGSDRAVHLLAEAWRDRGTGAGRTAPTLHDAVTALQLLDHCLRPLCYRPARADLGHAVANGLSLLPALAAKWQHGVPVLLTEHGVYLREQYLQHRRSPYRWPVKALHLGFLRHLCATGYREAAAITPGNAYNRRWEEWLGAEPARIRTVYNGVDPACFPAVDGEPGVPTISWVGRIDPIKDLETLLRAFALVRAEIPAARLRLFGSAPAGGEAYLQRCQTLASELGVAGATTFEGRVADIRDAYQAGSIVVLCSVSEGFPYSLIEAMTCARACVGTDVGGVTEALGDTGLVVPPRSPQRLAQACLTLLRDGRARRRLGAAARTRALEYFTVDEAINTFDEIYHFLGSGQPLPVAPAAEPDEPPTVPVPAVHALPLAGVPAPAACAR
jgi:polysaccharide biosynthesis protein PelF